MKEKGLFNRLSRAYDEGRPLNLRPGDVMMICHVLMEIDITDQEKFEIWSAEGGRKARWLEGQKARGKK